MSEKVYCEGCKFMKRDFEGFIPSMEPCSWCVNPNFGDSPYRDKEGRRRGFLSVRNKNNDCPFFELKWHLKLWKKILGVNK